MTAPISAPDFGLVEDSDEDFAAFERVLAKEAPGASVRRWRTAESLLADLTDAPGTVWPRALVVDLNLPGIDGAELVRRLRASPPTRGLPAFVLSGSGRQRDVDRCYDAGANAYLTKPGGTRELQALLRMLLASIATFRTPSAPTSTPVARDVSEVVDQPAIDATRDAYERELVEQRDAERRARRRAEALQRLSGRLAEAFDSARVESELLELLVGGGSGRQAMITPPESNTTQRDALFMPDPFGDGTIGLLPLFADGGRLHGVLRVEVTGALDDDEEALLHGAASLASQALGRIERGGGAGPWATGSAPDLPTGRWWHDAAQPLLDEARAQRVTATLVVVDVDVAAASAARGYVEADAHLLQVVDAWREAGHDLLAPLGTELFAAVLPGLGVRAAQALATEVHDRLDDGTSVRTAVAEWDGREPVDALFARARGALRSQS